VTPNLVWDRRAVSPPEGFTSGGPRPWPPGAAPRPALAPSPPPPRGGGAGGGDGTGGGPRGRRGRRPPRGAPAGGWDGPSRPRRALSPPLRDPPHGGAPRGPARTWGTVGALCRPSSRVPQGDGGRGGRRAGTARRPSRPGRPGGRRGAARSPAPLRGEPAPRRRLCGGRRSGTGAEAPTATSPPAPRVGGGRTGRVPRRGERDAVSRPQLTWRQAATGALWRDGQWRVPRRTRPSGLPHPGPPGAPGRWRGRRTDCGHETRASGNAGRFVGTCHRDVMR